jgi:hypothetical protein
MLSPQLANPAVGLETRRALRRWVAAGIVDEASATLIERALDKSRHQSACGWAWLLAEALGAPADRALRAAVACEWVYAAVDVTDDVQDGEAGAYLDAPWAIQVNTCTHLLTLALHAVCELGDVELTREVSALLSRMACGQRIEIARQDWTIESYVRMAHLTGSCQFEIYFRACAWAAGCDLAPLAALARPLGLLIHIAADERSADPRWATLAINETSALRAEACTTLTAAQTALSVPAQRVLAGVFEMARG